MKKIKKISIVTVLMIAVAFGTIKLMPVYAATNPTLGAASTFGVLSSTFTNSNTAPYTIVTGDIGYTVVGAPTTAPTTVNGTLHPEDATFTSAGSAQGTALSDLNSQSCTTITGPLDATTIGTNAPGVFPPGCYTMAGSLIITSGTSITLDLTATGGVGSTWIFKSTGGGLTTGADSFVTLANGASACNVFWAPVAATNIGAYTGALPNTTKLFIGTIIDAAGINLGQFANLSGRALAFGGTVTTNANTITVPTCTAPNLTLNKIVDGGSASESEWTLTAAGPSNLTGPGASGSADVQGDVTTGTYTLSESAGPSRYDASEWSCTGTALTGNSITLDFGDIVVCTITNTYDAPSSRVIGSMPTGTVTNTTTTTTEITPVPVTTTTVVTTVTPSLPKTGFGPQEDNSSWFSVTISNIINWFK